VRLPRDWVGPREELVPFGPAARARANRSTDPASVELLPPAAHDFWGEDSAALHDAMQAPPVDSPAPQPAVGRPERRRRRRWSVRRFDLSWRSSPWRHVRVRNPLILGVPAAALTALAIALVTPGAPNRSGPGGAAVAARPQAHVTGSGAGAGIATRSKAARRARLATPTRSAPTHTGATRARSRQHRSPARRRHKTTRNAGARRSPTRSAAPTYTPVSNPAPVQSTSAQPTASSDTTHSSTPSGPVGQGAPFGPGRIG
jgi:hypothetical protein